MLSGVKTGPETSDPGTPLKNWRLPLGCDEPGQACGQPVLEGSTREGSLLGKIERAYPSGMVDCPVAIAAALGDGRS